MQYILNETEYQAFIALKEENAKWSHRLEVANSVREKDCAQIKELMHVRDLNNKKLAEQAHELLCKEAELANLSSQVQSLVKENQTYCNQIAEMKRGCKGTSRVLKRTQEISAERLALVNNLLELVRRLKAEHVCIAQDPKTGTVKVISVVKVDTYRQFGWTVSEEFLVDRPA